jgi:peroxiredoxin
MEVLTLTGDTIALGSFWGDPMILNLWATWCGPCREETPYLQTLHETYSEWGLRVVGVSQDAPGSGSAIRAFMEEFGVTYTMLADPEMVAADRYGVIGLPATFLVDREGIIRQVVMGAATPGSEPFESTIRSIVQ